MSRVGILRARHRDPYVLNRHGIRTTDQWQLEHDETATKSCAVGVHTLVYQLNFVSAPRKKIDGLDVTSSVLAI